MGKTFHINFRVKKFLYPHELQVGSFSIVSCVPTENNADIKINSYGNFVLNCSSSPAFNYQDTYGATVEEFTHEKYGLSYKLISLDEEFMELTENSKRQFLCTVLTPTQYANLYECFEDPFEIIQSENAEELTKCKGIGKAAAKRVIEKYHNNFKYAKIIIQLSEYGLTPKMMDKLFEAYSTSERIIAKIKENVYILADEISGIGFKKCDKIALNGGMSPVSPFRLKAFMQYFLECQAQDGNSWVKPTIFVGAINDNLKASFTDDAIRKAMYELYDEKIITWNQDKTLIALSKYYNLERSIYTELMRLENNPTYFERDFNAEKEIIKITEEELGFEFTDEQKQSVDRILNSQVSLLIAKSGSGKTTLIKLLVRILNYYHKTSRIATLSGKASARIEEATGYSGSTIHRLLKWSADLDCFTYDKTNQLLTDVIIIDESSFLGGELFYSLISAIRNGAKLVLVGDDKQIPAIGVSNIFFDIINSNKFCVNVLTKIHRQAQKSGIITQADKIRNGQQITKTGWYGKEVRGELQDFTIQTYSERCLGKPMIMNYYRQFCKTLADTKDTVVIVPMKNRGEVNTFEINQEIQEEYNPHSKDKKEYNFSKNGKSVCLRVGDRVINCVNNYRAVVYNPVLHNNNNNSFLDIDFTDEPEEEITELFNGFCGEVVDIIDKKVIVNYDLLPNKPILMEAEGIRNLDLGYAITVHKMQGSEVPNVIMLIDYTSYIMNCRELIYTGVTRAKKQCVLLAEGRALIDAIKTTQTINKQTFLLDFLNGTMDINSAKNLQLK